MDYRQAREYMDEAAKYGSVLGLENIEALLEKLQNPQDRLKFIHISGTNGKGSVLAYLSTVMKEAGYKTGRYISPTLFSYRERIQVDEEYISREDFAGLAGRVKTAVEEMLAEGKAHPTAFEMETAISFLYFVQEKCDIVVLETGLGGLLDATNVVKTTVMEVITSVSMDHIGVLGNTLAEIAAQKAGIIKENTAVVSCEQEKDAMDVIERTATEKGCRLYVASEREAADVVYGYEEQSFSYKEYHNIRIRLAGYYQIKNAILALEAVRRLKNIGWKLTDEAVRGGFEKARWKGRFTLISREPVFIIDGAHNRDGAGQLKQSLELYFKGRRMIFIMGVFKDKEYDVIARMLAPMADKIFTVQTPDNPRALPAGELALAVSKYNMSVEAAPDIKDAVRKSIALAGGEDVIVAFGSLSFLKDIAEAVEQK